MINNPTAITKYKIQENVSEYPIGFDYSENSDSTPQLAVTINGSDATYGEHWVLSLDRKSVIVLAEEQVGAHLTIRRAIPLVQESDYQIGRIDPEQIESDFDASVERDQMLDEHIEALKERVRRDEEEIEKNRQDIETLQDEQLEQDAKIAKNTSDISILREEATTVLDTVAALQQNVADKASQQDLKDAITAERAISDGKYLPISDSKAFALKSALDATNKMVEQHTQEISDVMGDIAALGIDKQDKLVAGDHIKIEDNVISTDGVPDDVLVNNATESTGLAVGRNSSTSSGIAIGVGAKAERDAIAIGGDAGYHGTGRFSVCIGDSAASSGERGTAIGYEASVYKEQGIAIGSYARVSSLAEFGTIQIGPYECDGSGFYVGIWLHGNYQLMTPYGFIPAARLAAGGTDGQVLVKDGDLLAWRDMGGGSGSGLPDQTGHTGYLMTDGENAAWSDKVPLVNQSTGNWSLTITADNNEMVSGVGVTNINGNTSAGSYSACMGHNAQSGGRNSVAIGAYAVATESFSIQLGYGTNNEENCFYVGLSDGGNYKLLDADGHIPDERLPQLGSINEALAAILGTEV